MKVKVYNTKGNKKGTMTLPSQFNEEVRVEVVKRAFHSEMNNSRQKKGVKAMAGKNVSAYLSKRRRKYRGTYGRGRNRTPRKVMWRRGTQFRYVGAFAPHTVGGRKAHPPRSEKNITEKINDKERKLAIRSALSASANPDLIEKKHEVNDLKTPIVLSDDFEKLKKTKSVHKVLKKIGLDKELKRSKQKSIRSGKGKKRGRKYKQKKGLLFILPNDSKVSRLVRNIPGVDVNYVNQVSMRDLAPGGHPGRILVFTESSLKELKEDKLYQ